MPVYIIIAKIKTEKLLNIKEKKKNSEINQRKIMHFIQESNDSNMCGFLTQTIEVRRKCYNIFEMLNDSCQHRILYLGKTSFRNEGEKKYS